MIGDRGPNAGRSMLAVFELNGDELTVSYDLEGAGPAGKSCAVEGPAAAAHHLRARRVAGVLGRAAGRLRAPGAWPCAPPSWPPCARTCFTVFFLRRRRMMRGRRVLCGGAGRVPSRLSSSARHRYHAATERCGAQRSPKASERLRVRHRATARRPAGSRCTTPKSSTGRTSGRPSWNISSISTVQRPMPRTCVRRSTIASSLERCSVAPCSGTTPASVFSARSFSAAILAIGESGGAQRWPPGRAMHSLRRREGAGRSSG